MTLLGILLICYSARGQQLVFSHPPNLRQNDKKTSLFEPVFLSHLLSPRSPLCDRLFKLLVDNVAFLGHASLLNADRPGTGHQFSRAIQRKRAEKARQRASLLSTETSPSQEGTTTNHHLTMFHLVLVVKSVDNGYLDALYTQVISRIASALKYEQIRRLYIRKEAELILALKEEALLSNKDPTAQILESSSLARTLVHVYKALLGEASPHLEINSSLRLSLLIPEPSQFSSKKSLEDNVHEDVMETIAQKNGDEKESEVPSHLRLRPYQTLLLLKDAQETLQDLPPGTSPLLKELVQKANPLQSFEELQTLLQCTLSQIYKLAAHLVYWKRARIIDMVSIRNVYAVAADADFTLVPKLTEDFMARFSGTNLAKLLSILSVPRPLSTLLPSKAEKGLYLDMVIYLLRHNLVNQVHMYFCTTFLMSYCHGIHPSHAEIHADLKTPGDAPSASPLIDSSPTRPTAPSFLISDTLNPTDTDSERIQTMLKSRSAAETRLFLRILPYLNGEFHVDEIIFRENLSRKELKEVVSSFRDEIISSLYATERSTMT